MEAPVPGRTLYVRNLPEKLPKQRLRRLLHAAFSAHGRVVWIVAEKTMKLRGQAFITFERQAGATAALRALQSADFMGRPLVVAYARQETDRAGGIAFGGDGTETVKQRAARRRTERKKWDERQGAGHGEAGVTAASAANGDNEKNAMDPIATGAGVAVIGGMDANEAKVMAAPVQVVMPPNNILFVENVPAKAYNEDGDEVTGAESLKGLFARFSGFLEVRSVPGKDDIAFVEYSTDADAAVAMSGLNQHQLGDPPQSIRVNFAKK